MNHGHRHEHHIAALISHLLGRQHRVQQIVVLQTRNHLGNTGGAAGELKHRNLVRIPRHGFKRCARSGRRCIFHQISEKLNTGAGITAERYDMRDGRDFVFHLQRERDEIEFRIIALHNDRAGINMAAKIAYLLLAVRGKRAYRDQTSFQTAYEST